MKEIINEHSFVVALAIVAGLLFVAGCVVLLATRRKKTASEDALNKAQTEICGHRYLGLGLMISGPALWVLWLVYSSIVQRFGLDSVKGLGINIAIFIVAGTAIGVLLGVWQRQKR